ncbi:MAG: helix-hairpin-helix domain-containing protein [Gammaproteobacteria bacterium]|nr:helix-hairpin-helix domain-containing protein [Gammaproteobacteria bacterium]
MHPVTLVAALLLLTASAPSVRAAPAAPAPAGSATVIDLNSADVATLSQGLRGIGEAKARAIVEHRRRHGPFRSVDELALVKGIGPKTVERNRARLRVGGGPSVAVTGEAPRRPPAPSGAWAAEATPVIIEGMPRDD